VIVRVPDTNRLSVVMVGEGRPSTCFVFWAEQKQGKTKEKRGWSAFADHDGGS
jgi:hypothetical protein